MQTPSTYLAGRLREMRQRSGLTAKSIARELGITDRAIYNWENGRSQPSIDMLGKLGELFGCPISELIEEEDPDRCVFTSDEFDLINLYRSLPDEKKRLLRDCARAFGKDS